MKFCTLSRALAVVCTIVGLASSPVARGVEPGTAAAGKALVYSYTTNAVPEVPGPADLIIYNAKIITVDSKFSFAKAIAIHGDKILAVGTSWQLEKIPGGRTPACLPTPKAPQTVMPGLYDNHVSIPHSQSRHQRVERPPARARLHRRRPGFHPQASLPPNSARKLDCGTRTFLYPTRLKEGRFPTKAELDAAAPNNPVYWNSGPVSLINSKAIEVSKITKDTPNPRDGEIVREPKTYKPTGLLRNAASVLKLPAPTRPPTKQQIRDAVKHLYNLYNQQGITSIGERRTYPESIDLFRDLSKTGELTVRINCTRLMDDIGTDLDEAITNLDAITTSGPGKLPYGPTGVGDDWVRIGSR